MFKGKAMTYYGRWTYKYEIASPRAPRPRSSFTRRVRRAIPYEVVQQQQLAEQFDVHVAGRGEARPRRGVDPLDEGEGAARDAGQNFDSLKAAAMRKDFKPVALERESQRSTSRSTFGRSSRRTSSRSSRARDRKDEYVIYTAHWDHLGRDTTLKGDQIFNGAADNATAGGAARDRQAFKSFRRPERSILFLVGDGRGEGPGRLEVLREHPLYPLNKTPRTSTWTGSTSGAGRATSRHRPGQLDARRRADARPQGRAAPCGPTPSRRRASTTGPIISSSRSRAFRRSTPMPGTEFVGKPSGYGQKKRDEYTSTTTTSRRTR